MVVMMMMCSRFQFSQNFSWLTCHILSILCKKKKKYTSKKSTQCFQLGTCIIYWLQIIDFWLAQMVFLEWTSEWVDFKQPLLFWILYLVANETGGYCKGFDIILTRNKQIFRRFNFCEKILDFGHLVTMRTLLGFGRPWPTALVDQYLTQFSWSRLNII